MLILSFIMLLFNGFEGYWYISYFRYLLLFSSIIPISLRVNLDFAKAVFSFRISSDPAMPQTMARNSNIPEELGRIRYLLTDKTGTLTKNEMIFKKLVLHDYNYLEENLDELKI